MDRKTGELIIETVRGTFDLKTTNKLYSKKRPDAPQMLTTEEIDRQNDRFVLKKDRIDLGIIEATDDIKKELSKAVKRYQTRAQSVADKQRDKNVFLSTAYARGEYINDRLYLGEQIAGNCAEQSDVAAYLVIKSVGSDRDFVYLASVASPGDHVFCIVNSAKGTPTWANVAEMVNGCSNATSFILDPWMNFVCLAENYKETSAAKLGNWLGQGKRINWGGKTGGEPGWYQPGGDYLESFLSNKLIFEKAI